MPTLEELRQKHIDAAHTLSLAQAADRQAKADLKAAESAKELRSLGKKQTRRQPD